MEYSKKEGLLGKLIYFKMGNFNGTKVMVIKDC